MGVSSLRDTNIACYSFWFALNRTKRGFPQKSGHLFLYNQKKMGPTPKKSKDKSICSWKQNGKSKKHKRGTNDLHPKKRSDPGSLYLALRAPPSPVNSLEPRSHPGPAMCDLLKSERPAEKWNGMTLLVSVQGT